MQNASPVILVIDDDRGLRNTLRRILVRHGYEVLCASDGEAALAAARHHEGPIDVVLSDVRMAGASGPEILARLRAHSPNARLILMSGYVDRVTATDDGGAAVPFLEKPFGTRTLLDTILQLLAEQRPAA